MSSNIKVKLNKSQIKKVEKHAIEALEGVARDIAKDADVPVDTGNMKNNISVITNKNTVSLVNNESYSMRQYFHPEYNHGQGKSEWFEKYINGAKRKFMIDAFVRHYS